MIATLSYVTASADLLRYQVFLAAAAVFALLGALFAFVYLQKKPVQSFNFIANFGRFFYASFLKPHTGDGAVTGQQAALESFYKAQADVYDATRKRLLRGREDMLALAAAQLRFKAANGMFAKQKPIWVDIGGGTGYNIEAMKAFLDVPTFFGKVYLVDLSPSLLDVAKKRFARLGWEVQIVCRDARTFRLQDYEADSGIEHAFPPPDYDASHVGADLVTLSYSLSMIPDYYSVVDSIPSLLSAQGIVGVVDFYVQSIVDVTGRSYTGGSLNRHVNWLGRVFWRAWFDFDRVGLEGARRDYLEYRLGTLKTVDQRNYLLGGIPYYIYLGTPRNLVCPLRRNSNYAQKFIEDLDASCTEVSTQALQLPANEAARDTNKSDVAQLRSKSYQCAVINLSSNIPLPSMFYQNNQRRLYYDDQLQKHSQFGNEYIYAFTWEDPRVDHRLLKIRSDDAVLCVTSAGDNVLDYVLHAQPRRVHAVDLNPNQNHLLELKVAAFQSLSHQQVWALFGEGQFPDFRDVLISKLSPHLSSQAFQFWLNNTDTFTSSRGLYDTGGSRHAITLVRQLFRIFGLSREVEKLCKAKTLNEQREIWPKVRRVLMSKPLHWAVIGTEWFAWSAAGVPPAQSRMIINDYTERTSSAARGEAIWQYVVNTLDPAVRETLLSDDNYFYLLCLQGRYSRRSCPQYLTPKAHAKLSRQSAFDCLRIHTDEIQEVIARISPGTLDHAVIMDSMDWFNPQDIQAATQVKALNRALKVGAKVLLRSAGLEPWYIPVFETNGFNAQRVGARLPGTCIDRVNMYASTWICVKF